MPYWINETLRVLPAFLWVYILLGMPFALLLLPRASWGQRALVTVTGFALGSGLLTLGMFILGSQPIALLTRDNVMVWVGVFTLVGWVMVFAKTTRTDPPPSNPRIPLTPGEHILIAGVVAAVAIRMLVMAYWPFTAYDALWVYGYQGRLYTLLGTIPASIDYYPQYLPLQYTFGQLVYGGINDSAARAVLPLLHIGSILAAYVLGKNVFNRRTGIFLASLWALYPAVGEWARMGDLEIPLTFLITTAAAYFFTAWTQPNAPYRNRYALIAGIIYGIALWTKPTAGAFALGIILINGVAFASVRFRWANYAPRFIVSLITGLACIPMGGMWYLRNILLGHNAVDFPPEYWYTLAERGGGQLLWYLAGLLVVIAYVYHTQRHLLQRRGLMLFGLLLLWIGILPSTLARFLPTMANTPLLWIFPSLDGLPRMGVAEWSLTIIGLALCGASLRSLLITAHPPKTVSAVLWILAATIPYFIVFFWRYSYHYRLAFAIVPMMATPIAVTLAAWFPNDNVRRWRLAARWRLAGLLLVVALPGMILPLYDPYLGWQYLWASTLSDDVAKRESGNEALMWMIDGFRIYQQEYGTPPVVVAPGVQRLPFFFPLGEMHIETAPTRLSQLNDAFYFVDSHPDGTGIYNDIPILENQVLSALGRNDIMRWAWGMDDGIFRYDIYELSLANRYSQPTPINAVTNSVIVGGFARFLGHDAASDIFEIGQVRTIKLFWEVLETPNQDYMTYIHLRDTNGNVMQAWDGPVGLTDDGRYYTTLVWEPNEYITDERRFRFTHTETPPGEGYHIVIGMYDLATGQRVPITVNGAPAGDGFRLDESITVIPPQE